MSSIKPEIPHAQGQVAARRVRSAVITTLVAEPSTLTREGMLALLGREQGIEVIAAVRDAAEVVPTAQALRPAVALVAVSFPGHDGIHLARELQSVLPECSCAVVSARRHAHLLRRAVAAQLRGFIVADAPAEFITESVRQLAAGNKVLDPGLTFSALDDDSCPLTSREAEALTAAAKGLTTAEIAGRLCVTVGTVRNYLSRAIVKSGARNRVDAIRIADESGWL